jgi:D-glycero-alpha-D-manno-heptose-7-phosphate kinase
MADVPSTGSGLGSSSTVTVGLLNALYAHAGRPQTKEILASDAVRIEVEILAKPIGKQDQYIAAYGGLTCFTFHKEGRVEAEPLKLPIDAMFNLEDNLLLFFTGFSRTAGSILADQQQRTGEHDAEMLANLHYVKDLGHRSRLALEKADTAAFGELMHEHWEHKKRRSKGMSNPQIDEWYELGRRNGAIGGKLVGAGGGGFLMFYAEDHRRLRTAMASAGLEEVRFRFDFEGTKVLFA